MIRLRLEFATRTAGAQLPRLLRLLVVRLVHARELPALLDAAPMDGQLTMYAFNLQ